jgi:hypothetical protein
MTRAACAMKSIFLGLGILFFSSACFASQGLIIHSEEFGVGKFHREDNKAHPYAASSAWAPYILADGAAVDQPLIQKNADGSFTVFFSTLDDLVVSVIQISTTQKQKVSVLNVHGHGIPGGMWFPKDAATMADSQCDDWREAANGSDADNYAEYYSATSVEEIQQIQGMSEDTQVQMGCVTDLHAWQDAVAKTPAFKQVFADDAQVHFLSCVVGMGTLGANFTQGIAALLLPTGNGRVESSVDFGLGDWSMPEGMGFWDYQSDAQVDHDNSIYVVDHKDREIAQKGTVRMASFSKDSWGTQLLSGREFLSLGFEAQISGTPTLKFHEFGSSSRVTRVRIPGTRYYTSALQ